MYNKRHCKKKCYKNILMTCDSILSPCQGSEIENTQLVGGKSYTIAN